MMVAMQLTKYDHACLLIDKDGRRLLIDPGSYTKLPDSLANIDAVVITHEHLDHLDVPNLRRVLGQSPAAKLFSTGHVADSLRGEGIDCQAITGQSTATAGGFELHFREVDHSIIYGVSSCRNLCLGVGDFLYYPGDSFAAADRCYQVLALPASGPWFNMAEAIDMAKGFDGQYIFATHDIHASSMGYDSFYSWVGRHIGDGPEMIRLAVGDSRDF